jgi:PhoPQ-activated pathogenicity-related protein
LRYAFCLFVGFFSAVPAFAAPSEVPSELSDYVSKPDNSFSWKVASRNSTDFGTVYTIDLVSQTWHDIKWDHKLQVYLPKSAKPQSTMVLWNQGGTPGITSGILGLEIAAKINAPVAFLFGVPKQPLFGGKTEDGLIAETFVRYLETKDPTWPLLFPMVKSIVRGMDALQAFAKEEWKFDLTSFIVTGASKRGWTTWLTAALGDKRVKAISPLVFDTLNIGVQMKNQIIAFDKPSEMIKDYVERKLVPIPQTEAAQRLWVIIDPWSYREKITVPKLIINGTNDPYWPLDALNTYWDGLKGDKWLLYVPNAGHNLTELDKNGKADGLPVRALQTLAAFSRSQIFDKPMPKLECSIQSPPATGYLDISVSSNTKPVAAWTFSASAKTRDFRKSWWEPMSLKITDNKTEYRMEPPKTGYAAAFIDLEFELDGIKYNLSTPLRILGPTK